MLFRRSFVKHLVCVFVQLGVLNTISLLSSPFQTVVCWLSACACYLVYQWHHVGFVCDIVCGLKWTECRKNKESPNQFWNKTHIGVHTILCLVASLPDVFQSRGTVSQWSDVSGEQEINGTAVQSQRNPKCQRQAAVSDTPSRNHCPPQRADLLASWTSTAEKNMRKCFFKRMRPQRRGLQFRLRSRDFSIPLHSSHQFTPGM